MGNREKTNASLSYRGLTARDVLHSIFKRLRLFIGLPLLIIILIVIGSLILPPVYEAHTDLKIESTDYENVGLIDRSYDTGEELVLHKNQQINSEINIASSDPVLSAVVRQLGLWERWSSSDRPEELRVSSAVSTLRGGLSIEPSLDSWIITIRYRNYDPELATRIVNALAEEYISRSIQMHTRPQAAQFYEERIERERDELAQLQDEFRGLVENSQIVDYSFEVQQKLTNRSSFEERLTSVRTEILTTRTKVRRITEFLNENPDVLIPIPEIAQIRIVEDLNYRMANLRLELSALLQKFTERERRVQSVVAQIEALEGQLREEVRKIIRQDVTELRRFEAEAEALVAAIAQIDRELVSMQTVEAPFANTLQLIENKQLIISQLSMQYTDNLYAGETDSRLARVRQIGPARVPLKPVFPDLNLNLLIGIPIALLIGLAVTIFFDYFDRTFPTPERAERVTGLPVLATINNFDIRRRAIFR